MLRGTTGRDARARHAKDDMALNQVRGNKGRGTAAEAEPLAIGAVDRDVFACPNCMRPLRVGTSRCFGCDARLVLGIASQKAALLLAIGTALGLLAGVVGGLAFATITAPVTPAGGNSAVVVPLASAAADASAAPSAVQPVASGPTVPSLTRSSIGAAAEVDNRLAVAAGALHAELHRADPRARTITDTFRAIAADTAHGVELANGMATWTGTSAVSAELKKFYSDIRDLARNGLKASGSNAAAYRNAAAAMVQALAVMPAIDSRLRQAATTAGVKVPPFFWVVAQAPGG
jgi:hypothetical protein